MAGETESKREREREKAEVAVSCWDLQDTIRRNRFQIVNVFEDAEKCIIDFKHPKIKVEPPVSYYLSSVALDKKDGSIETTVRSKVETFKELYLDYCCEDGLQVCRPHVNMEEKILSVEAKFWQNPRGKFDRLLDEMR
jgi:hypothetical protein